MLLCYSTVDAEPARDRALREPKIRHSILAKNPCVAKGHLEAALSRLADLERCGETTLEQAPATVDAFRSVERSIEKRRGQVVAVTEGCAREPDRCAHPQGVVSLRRSLSRGRASRKN